MVHSPTRGNVHIQPNLDTRTVESLAPLYVTFSLAFMGRTASQIAHTRIAEYSPFFTRR